MKSLIFTFICIFSLSALSTAQEESFNELRKEINRRDGVHSFTVPGFLVRLVGGIALKDEDFIEREAIRPLVRNMASVSIVFTEDDNSIDYQEIQEFKHRLADENYETLLRVKDHRENIEIFSWGKKDVIKRLLLVIHEEDSETVILNIRGHFRQRDIDEMIDSIEKNNRSHKL